MTSAARKWLAIGGGIAILLVFLAIGAAVVSVAWFRENIEVAQGTSPAAAAKAFDDAKSRYTDPRPVVEFDKDRRPTFVQGIDTRRNAGTVNALHVLAWDADARALATVTLPMWLLRLKSGPIQFGEYASGFDDHGVRLSPEDLERYGPGVVFELETAAGSRVLLTTQ